MKNLCWLMLFFGFLNTAFAQDVTGTWHSPGVYKAEWFQDGQNVYSIYTVGNLKHYLSGRFTSTNHIEAQVVRIDVNNNCRTVLTFRYTLNGNTLTGSWTANDSNCDLQRGQTSSEVITRTTASARPMNPFGGTAFNPATDVTGSWSWEDDWLQDNQNVYYIANGNGFKQFFKGIRSGNQITGQLIRYNPSGCRMILNQTFTQTDANTMRYTWVAQGNCDVTNGQREEGTITRKVTPSATTITLSNIDEWLCPKAVLRGDREFDGHGPRIKCEVTLSIGDAGKALYADIYLWAQETVHDWSTTERRWRKKVYDAPYGKTITAINSDKASRTQFISPAGGFQFLVPGNDVASVVNGFLDGVGGSISNAVLASFGIRPGDFQAVARLVTGAINSGNTVVRVPAIEGTLVKFFHIVGDTGGADISEDDNCNDDTRIVKLEFNPVNVTFR